MRSLDITNQYKKDLKKAFRQGRNTDALDAIILLLLNDETLPQKHRDHELIGNRKGHRELHIESDWLLICKIENNAIVLPFCARGVMLNFLENSFRGYAGISPLAPASPSHLPPPFPPAVRMRPQAE